MSRLPRLFVFVTLCLLPAMASAQFNTEHPGYFPIEDLGILPEENITLEINLTGPMIKFIALAADEEEPELSRLVEGLESIRVRGADLDTARAAGVRSGIRNATQMLTEKGWNSMVRMRDEDEEVYIYFKEQEGEMMGLTVLSLEGDEAMLINLVGKIDPAGLGSLASGLDLPQLEQAVQEADESQ